jgi:hypothetical protein
MTRTRETMPVKARGPRILIVINCHAIDVNPFEVSTSGKTI